MKIKKDGLNIWINPLHIIDINDVEVEGCTVINLNNKDFYKIEPSYMTFDQIVDCVETELREIHSGKWDLRK